MPSPTRHASPSRRPSIARTAPSLSSLVTLDLSKPGEKRAHDFLCYATDKRDPMWTLLDVQRHANVLLCVVRWVCPHRNTKPFAMAELVARIKALLRRPGGALGIVLSAADIELDTLGRDVRIRGQTVAVPRQEVALLEQLLRRLGRVVPRAVLEDKLYAMEEEPESNAIPVHIHRLRKRLDEAGAGAEIHTVRGVGYVLMERKR